MIVRLGEGGGGGLLGMGWNARGGDDDADGMNDGRGE
jgi:hypothetical protein